MRSGGLADGSAQPVVLATGIEASETLWARAIPTLACTVDRSCNDRLPRLFVIATDQHEGSIRANLSEQRMDRVLIRSDLRDSARGPRGPRLWRLSATRVCLSV
jgi:hypothetical protein